MKKIILIFIGLLFSYISFANEEKLKLSDTIKTKWVDDIYYNPKTDTVKKHLKKGLIFVKDTFKLDTTQNIFRGKITMYDFRFLNRSPLYWDAFYSRWDYLFYRDAWYEMYGSFYGLDNLYFGYSWGGYYSRNYYVRHYRHHHRRTISTTNLITTPRPPRQKPPFNNTRIEKRFEPGDIQRRGEIRIYEKRYNRSVYRGSRTSDQTQERRREGALTRNSEYYRNNHKSEFNQRGDQRTVTVRSANTTNTSTRRR